MILLSAVIGLIIGSFLNNYISYLSGFSKLDTRRSTCLCGEYTLQYFELVPVLSYVLLKTKCRICGKRISPRYLIVEILAAIIISICFASASDSFHFVLYSILILALLTLSVVDYFTFKIPNQLIILITILAIIKVFYEKDFSYNLLLPPVLVFIFFSFINFLYIKIKEKRAIGFGDVKLLIALSIFFNFKLTLIGIWVASFIAIPGYLILKGINAHEYSDRKVPFGLFISISYTLILFGRENILHYFNLLGGY